MTITNEQSRETGNIDEEKQNKSTTQYVLDTTMRKQTKITQIRHESPRQTTGGNYGLELYFILVFQDTIR